MLKLFQLDSRKTKKNFNKNGSINIDKQQKFYTKKFLKKHVNFKKSHKKTKEKRENSDLI